MKKRFAGTLVAIACSVLPFSAFADDAIDAKKEAAEARDVAVGSIARGVNERRDIRASVEPALMMALADRIEDPAAPQAAEAILAQEEAARTDKQVGASADAPGSTSLVEKAGIPYFLSLALERGAIQQEHTATAFTLSTTPYMIAFLGQRDTQYNFERYGFWRRIGLSASFAVEKDEETTVNDLKTEDLAEMAIRFGIFGDRSTRSAGFQKCWRGDPDCKYANTKDWPTVTPRDTLQSYSDHILRSVEALYDDAICGDSFAGHADRVKNTIGGLPPAEPEIQKSRVNAILDAEAQAILVDLGTPTTASCLEIVRQEMGKSAVAYGEVTRVTTELVEKYMEREDLLTLSISQHPIDDGTDFTQITLVYEREFQPVELTLNGDLSLNNNPGAGEAAGSEQDVVRDYGLSAALSYEIDASPLGRTATNPRPFVLTGAGNVTYSEELNDPIGMAQLRVEIPVYAGVTIPLAVSYASRTETDSDDEFTFSLGTGFDLDAFAAIVRGNRS
jgi:hypothetical protein